MDKQILQILDLLGKCSDKQKEIIFKELRKNQQIHPIEKKLNISAEVILEAIHKDQTGLTFRMMRGVIAEAAFEINVLANLESWKYKALEGDFPFDFVIVDPKGEVSIQVKLQRSLNFQPMLANEALRIFSNKFYVVETQKTRGGIDPITKEDTRPYRFGEFNILAVSMQPSTLSWDSFMYTVSDWLIPQYKDAGKMLKFQPVSPVPNEDWTDNLSDCINWFRSGEKKKISL